MGQSLIKLAQQRNGPQATEATTTESKHKAPDQTADTSSGQNPLKMEA